MAIKCKVEFFESFCTGCGLCVSACPTKILYLDETRVNEVGAHPASVSNVPKCIGCGSCTMICPNHVITLVKE